MVRLKYIISYGNSLDQTCKPISSSKPCGFQNTNLSVDDNVDVVIWSVLETFAAVMCASLMCLRPLVKFLPSIFPATRASYDTPNPKWSAKLASKIRNPNSGVELHSEDEEARTGQSSKVSDMSHTTTWLTENSSVVMDSIEMHEHSPRASGGPHHVDHNSFY